MKQSRTRWLYVAVITILLALCLGGLMACNSGEATDTDAPAESTEAITTEAPETVCPHAYEETVIEATNGTDDRLIYEASDMIYHLIVLLTSKGMRIEDLATELKKRHKV